MEAYRIDRFGSIDGVILRSSDDPRPGPRQVLMRVRARCLNYRDLMVLKGGGRGPTKVGVIEGFVCVAGFLPSRLCRWVWTSPPNPRSLR
jgi:NADPH:quinone reductase-like Zn-dependent oxidoreductase